MFLIHKLLKWRRQELGIYRVIREYCQGVDSYCFSLKVKILPLQSYDHGKNINDIFIRVLSDVILTTSC